MILSFKIFFSHFLHFHFQLFVNISMYILLYLYRIEIFSSSSPVLLVHFRSEAFEVVVFSVA